MLYFADADTTAEAQQVDAHEWVAAHRQPHFSLGQLSQEFFNSRVLAHARIALGEDACTQCCSQLSKAHKVDSRFCRVAIEQCIGELVTLAEGAQLDEGASGAADAVVEQASIWRVVLDLHAVRASLSWLLSVADYRSRSDARGHLL